MDSHTSLRERVHHAFQGITQCCKSTDRCWYKREGILLEYDEQVTVRSCKVESRSYQVARVGCVFLVSFLETKEKKKV